MNSGLATRMVGAYAACSRVAPFLGRPLSTQPISQSSPVVFVVGDNPFMREGLEPLIDLHGWRSEKFVSVEEFLSVPEATVPCCLILDVSRSSLRGLELQKRFTIERKHIPIIFVAHDIDVRVAVQAMKGGAVEFLTKPLNRDLLLSAIREAIERSRIAINYEKEMQALRERYATLSRRERQVMELVVSGLLNKQVGAELGISEITVKSHRGQLMQKMSANSLPDLVRMSARLELGCEFRRTGSAEILNFSISPIASRWIRDGMHEHATPPVGVLRLR